jgi:release factor glutamine methyltransferase
LKVGEGLRAPGIDPRESRLLLAEATGFSEASLVGSEDKELPEEASRRFHAFASRRRSGEPIAYIVGHKEFYSLDLAVTPAVLIPRPETELLVDLVLEMKPSSVVDLGTGSGAIALAVKKHLPRSRVVAVEASAAGLEVARRNAVKHGLEVEFRHGRWLEPLAGERFAMIVANPPYVASGDPHLSELRFEPPSALVSGPDGLDAIREITRCAPAHLLPEGWLLLEHGIGQDSEVRRLLGEAGLEGIKTWPDLAGIPRVSRGRR